MRIGHRELSSNRTFGVELEVSSTFTKRQIAYFLNGYETFEGSQRNVIATKGEGNRGWAETRRNDYWHVKYDSTCGVLGKRIDHGWEIASYIGKGHMDVDSIARAAGYLEKCGVEVNQNCGLHIHVGAGDLNDHQVGLLMARWIKVEPYLLSICDKSRTDNRYCRTLFSRFVDKSISYHPYQMSNFYFDMSPKNLQIHNNKEKKYALNFVGYATGKFYDNGSYDKSTIELRLPECQLNYEYVLNWTRLFLNFVDSCLAYPSTGPTCLLKEEMEIQDIMSYLGLQDKEGFWMLDEHLLDTKKWLLNRLINSQKVSLSIVRQAESLLDFISQI